MHEKLFSRSRLKISYQTPPLVLLFSVLFGFLLSPVCVTHNSLFSLQNPINLNFSSSVNLLCSSCEDMMLYNKHKIFCKYLLRARGPRRNHVSKVYFMVKKQKKCCKTLQQSQTQLILLQCFGSIFLPQKLNLLQCLMGGPRAAFYIRAQRRTFLLRVDEKCCSWPMYELNSQNVAAFEQIR